MSFHALPAAARDAYKRMRAKNARQVLRTIALRVWPLSILARTYYRHRFRRRIWVSINRSAIEALRRNPPRLNSWQHEAVDQLRTSGIYVGDVTQLASPAVDVRALTQEVQLLIEEPDFQRQIRRRESRDGARWYFVRAIGLKPRRPLPKNIALFFLHEEILGVVNTYLGLWSRMSQADLFYNFPVGEGERPIDSERWHRDHEDNRNICVYVFISDVDDETGPFVYARQTHPYGQYARDVPPRPPAGVFLTDEELFRRVPKENILTCTGQPGTLIICDTAGFHRGGRAVRKPRTVLMCRHVSDAGVDIRHYDVPGLRREELSPAAQYALGLPLAPNAPPARAPA